MKKFAFYLVVISVCVLMPFQAAGQEKDKAQISKELAELRADIQALKAEIAQLKGKAPLPLVPVKKATDGGPIVVVMPKEDIMLWFTETRHGMTVKLTANDMSVEGKRLYLGDGKVAAELKATHQVILFQGEQKLYQGFKFRKDFEIWLNSDHKKAADLQAGDVYVILPGVIFKTAEK